MIIITIITTKIIIVIVMIVIIVIIIVVVLTVRVIITNIMIITTFTANSQGLVSQIPRNCYNNVINSFLFRSSRQRWSFINIIKQNWCHQWLFLSTSCVGRIYGNMVREWSLMNLCNFFICNCKVDRS